MFVNWTLVSLLFIVITKILFLGLCVCGLLTMAASSVKNYVCLFSLFV